MGEGNDRGDDRAEADRAHMARAIALARRGEGRTRPNPLVGCVLVRDGVVLAEGWHERAGGHHAEVAALSSIERGAARGATAYVSLEPCSHHGRTPPCCEALLEAGVTRVVAAMIDPDPRVSGAGVAWLGRDGVEVEVGLLQDEALRLNAPYIKRMHTGLPWVVAKWAMSLDGKIAAHTGDSAWISGEESRALVHRLRDRHDAVMVGTGTLRSDDPRLTCRLPPEEGARDPVRVVLDARLEAPPTARVYELAARSEAPTLVAYSPALLQHGARRARLEAMPGVELLEVEAGGDGMLVLEALLRQLAGRGLMSVLVEGGAGLLGSLWDARLVDEAYAFVAPRIIGGVAAPSAAGGRGVATVSRGARLVEVRQEAVGDDVLIHGLVHVEDRAHAAPLEQEAAGT